MTRLVGDPEKTGRSVGRARFIGANMRAPIEYFQYIFTDRSITNTHRSISMELRHLRYFVAVCEDLSFSRAAVRMRVAQPALSVQIKALENELGVQLLERTSRSVRLTHAGTILLGEARTVLAAAQRAEQQVRRAGRGMVGTLRIGIIASAANARLARQLRSYRDAFPEVDLSLHEVPSATQIELLLNDQLDVGFLRPPVDASALESRFLDEAHLVLAAPAKHRLAQAAQITWKDFDREPLVMVQPGLQHGFYDRFLALCAESGARPAVGQYAHDVQTVLWLVSAGLGISPITETLIELKRPGLVFRPLPPGMPMVRTMLVWKKNSNSPLLREFLRRLAGEP
jgi:DNA-binding transcriptional LysR family regulator